ncbi:MAG: Mrp/NBP35 family ATP-binding protein [Planctomycetes bacterium]|nr:Mrp/NBP35 family ATP-binding protein [Planctomycetota bacterium]
MPEILTPMDRMEQQTDRMKENISRVRYKIAVMSGKGGVGKTTVAVNLAALFAAKGYKVGLLDADIDCPNIGKILGINETFQFTDSKRLIPIEKYDIKIASMSFFGQPEDTPHIFRGPIIHSAIMQMLEMTEWGLLDFLIIDMPPGTSDAALTIMQFVPLDGIVIVTTPQELSLQDATRSANVAKQFGKRFGIVENMAGDVFGKGADKIARQLDAPFLGSLPLSKEIRESCDKHMPIVLASEKIRKEFEKIVENLKKKVLG